MKLPLDIGKVLLLLFCFCSGCVSDYTGNVLTEEGVSVELARFRKQNYRDITYDLFFSIPEKKEAALIGEINISLFTRKKVPLIIDFRADESQVLYVRLNGKPVPFVVKNEHIILDPKVVKSGKNQIQISFTPDDQSLNRREEFLYTLLVPDRARTLFPCFDQPDMKAVYALELELPVQWDAVSNGIRYEEKETGGNRKTLSFVETEPLSTYLFSFVAGKLETVPFERNGRTISVYHRETDPKKVGQCNDIAGEVLDALEWMEAYTGIPYPFAKYDLIILPGFQYGGMEHTGATLYTDRRMFLNEQPTLNERLSRSALIAHETAHMWFGDYVTMAWFDDVWTKEVFANYFASKIVEPLYPEVNHALNFMLDYFPSSYAEDRTAGSNPVKQELDNLRNAGLVYGNIIYNKSPIVLAMLIDKMGEEPFQEGIREYLKTFAYGNATWDDLIAILDRYTDEDLNQWSRIWIHEKGMPVVQSAMVDDSVVFTQSDPFGRGLTWPQTIHYLKAGDTVIPNSDGKAYGFFRLDEPQIKQAIALLHTSSDEVLRGSLLLTLYENLLNHTLAPDMYMEQILIYLSAETNPLLYALALQQVSTCYRLFTVQANLLENTLWKLVTLGKQPSFQLQALRVYNSIAGSEEAVSRLFTIWKEQRPPVGCTLSETDYMNLSYQLAVRLPEKADAIVAEQLKRISNPDRKQEYSFISPAVSPHKEVRDSVFQSLLIASNRRVEPWASSALSYLNHRLRQQEAIGYIRPALDILREVQRTGDIFFPTAWLRALLSGHTSPEARTEVDTFFSDHPDYPSMLSNKIKQQADFLYRIDRMAE